MQPTPAATSEGYRLGALILICLVLFFSGLGSRALWDTDEGLHATTSKIMVQSGDWVVPQFNGRPFFDKPPLFNWLVALSFLLFGFTEFAARLPSAVLGLLTVLATYLGGRRLVGARAAFLGAIVLATSVEFVVLSSIVVHDILLVLFGTLASFAFYLGYADERRRTLCFMGMYLAVGVAVLAKGPVGAVLPGGTILLFLALRGELRFVPRLMLARGALVAGLVAVPPYLLTALEAPGYLRYFLLDKNLGSYVSAASRHPQPFYYYVPTLFAGLFPWSAFLPLTVWRLLRRPAAIDPARLFLLVWSAFVLVFFSAATSKLATYVAPLFPAVALLVGDVWAGLIASGEEALRKGVTASYLVLAAILAWMVPGLWLEAARHPLYDAALHRHHLIALTGILATSVVVGLALARLRRFRALFASTAAVVAALMLYTALALVPMLDSYRSSKEIARRIDALLPPGQKIAFFPEIGDAALFYTDREGLELTTPARFEQYLGQPGALCIVDTSYLPRVERLRDRFRIVDSYGNKVIVEAVPSETAHIRE